MAAHEQRGKWFRVIFHNAKICHAHPFKTMSRHHAGPSMEKSKKTSWSSSRRSCPCRRMVTFTEGATGALPPRKDEIEKLLAIAPRHGVEFTLPGH